MSISILCYKILLSCTILADLIAVHLGADCHLPTADRKENVILNLVIIDVGKDWLFSFISHAVDTGLSKLKDDCLLVCIIAGPGDPLGLTFSIH